MVNETVNDKKQVVKRILNHALGIIYLLTGEEYIVMKKTSPHSSDHLVTGEVPVKCGDVSVYFSMEEWDFIEGHKDIYKDVVLQNQLSETPASIPANQPQGPHDEKSLRASSGEEEEEEEEEDKKPEQDIARVQIQAEVHAGAHDEKRVGVSSGEEEEEDEKCGLNIEQLQIQTDPSEDDAEAGVTRAAETQTPQEKIELDNEKKVPTCPTEITTINEFGETQTELYSFDDAGNASVPYGLQEEDFMESKPDVNLLSENTSIVRFTLPVPDERKPQTSNDGFPGDFKDVTRYALLDVRNTDGAYLANVKHLQAYVAPPAIYNEEKPFHCQECGKLFSLKCQLLVHQKKHAGEKLFQCNECGKEVTTRRSLTIHQRIHTGEKPYKCTECEKHFSSKPYLIEHLRTHTGVRPHMCNQCGKQFPYKSYLLVHLRSHNGGRPHQCAVCGKDFDYRSRLLVHQRTHTGLKPHICHICGKPFDYKSYLSRHLKTHGIEES
uniref:C2H2-type domain-containing protein n=1 Tax=Leptobrachium leishanense TaxID=445787 RepID=A0A8C5PWM3_9ANUR